MKFVKSLGMVSALIALASGSVLAEAGGMMVQDQHQISSQDMARLQSRLNQGNGSQNQYQYNKQYRYQNQTGNSGYGRGYESRRGSGSGGFGGNRGGGRH